jgi:opacity protein-like surface antigen
MLNRKVLIAGAASVAITSGVARADEQLIKLPASGYKFTDVSVVTPNNSQDPTSTITLMVGPEIHDGNITWADAPATSMGVQYERAINDNLSLVLGFNNSDVEINSWNGEFVIDEGSQQTQTFSLGAKWSVDTPIDDLSVYATPSIGWSQTKTKANATNVAKLGNQNFKARGADENIRFSLTLGTEYKATECTSVGIAARWSTQANDHRFEQWVNGQTSEKHQFGTTQPTGYGAVLTLSKAIGDDCSDITAEGMKFSF